MLHGSLVALAIASAFLSFNLASAQVTLNQFRPAERAKDGFAISRPDDQGHMNFGFQLWGDYANDPLVYELVQGSRSTERYSVVKHQLTGHLVLSLGIADRLVLYAGLPVNLLMEGSDNAPTIGGLRADGFGISDPWFGGRLRLVGENDDIGSLGVQVTGTAPVAELADKDTQLGGENGWTVHPELLAELRPGGVKFTLNAGARVRNNETLGDVRLRDEVTFGAGVTVPIVSGDFDDFQLNAHGEIYGATPLKSEDFGDREQTPLEAIGGLKAHVSGWAFGAAAGPGLNRGVGSPDVRVVGMLGYMGENQPKKEVPREPVVGDRDGDGLLDDRDQCPDDPEDADRFEDEDGCPDPDNDQDGVPDVSDGAPLDPEDKDNFQDEDGVPDPDNDGDAILDADDQCPNEAEDKDGFQDEDGCPDPDNDSDTVLDVDDQCPLTPGTPEDKGCPKTARLDAATGRILILQRVEFLTASSDVAPEKKDKKSRNTKLQNEQILNDVLSILKTNPQIKVVRVEGHTDTRGNDAANMKLSRGRAQSVADWLVSHGIESSRVVAFGCGENVSRPENEKEGMNKNERLQADRRTEFHIIDPAPPGGARNVPGCEAGK